MSSKRCGSSQAIEFFISLFVGVLAILGAVFIVGFLLVEPVRNPPGQSATVVSIDDLMETCDPTFQNTLLLHGCTINKQSSVERAVCSNRECSCDPEQPGSVCCCRTIREEPFDNYVCPEGVAAPQIKNSTLCGCTVCDDINIRVHLTVVNRDTEEPIPAALVLRHEGTESFTLLGITNNHGRYVFNEPVATFRLALKVIASGYVPYLSVPMRLHPHKSVLELKVVMIPHMNVQLGLGGSALTLRLGSMAAVTAPAGAFQSEGQTYEDFVTFQGMFLTPQDPNQFSGVPGGEFAIMNEETGQMDQYGVLFVTRLEFLGMEGETLTASNLVLQVSVMNNDGELPELCLIVYNETSSSWEKFADFQALPDFRKKRQLQPVILENANVPISVFAAVASRSNADCWLQGRTFDVNGAPVSGPFISVEQSIDVSGNELLLRFGTNTGAHSSNGLVTNAICLPVHCGPFIIATLESREGFDDSSQRLNPLAFPPDTFNITENAPIDFGTLFSFEELILSTMSRARPFYETQSECVLRGQDASATSSEFFSFAQVNQEIPRPVPFDHSCIIKVQILDCFLDNSVTVTSVNPDTGTIDDTQTITVTEPDEMLELPTDSSGMFLTTEPPTDPAFCDDTTASLRAACIPFVCGDNVQLIVRPNALSNRTSFCEITDRSVFLSNALVSDINNNAQLIVRTNVLVSDDYNNPDLGLYHVPGNNMMAMNMTMEICNAGVDNSTSTMIDVTQGAAVTFSCF